jgi:predicted RNA binding protein YcfA (HicA-like mRNA interferase family)
MANEIRFSLVRKILEEHGWALTRIAGSHHVFTKADNLPISIPVHRGRVKAIYVRKVERIIAEEERRKD